MYVKDVMTREVVTVAPETPLKDVAAILVERRISGLPVVDPDGSVLGVVSEADFLLRDQIPSRGGILGFLLDSRRVEDDLKLGARTAGEAMSVPAVTIAPDAPLPEAAALMVEEGVKRLPVLEKGRLVGILTRADIVRAFIRPDAEIAREIRDELVWKTLWIDPPKQVAVEVERGDVRLRGRLDRRSDAELLERLARRIPGVVSVSSELTWRRDNIGRKRAALSARGG